jgi:hypothetical protein
MVQFVTEWEYRVKGDREKGERVGVQGEGRKEKGGGRKERKEKRGGRKEIKGKNEETTKN